jgi:hypothetical protein
MFNIKITWRLHIKMVEAKVFRTFIRIYSLFRSKRLNISIKLTLPEALIRSVTTYACPPLCQLDTDHDVNSSCGWRKWPSDMEASCEYFAKRVTDSRQTAVRQLWVVW